MDLQFVMFQDALRLTGVREIPLMTPRSLQILGKDFHHAVEVQINETKSPSFVIANSKTIIAQVPSGQVKSNIRSVSVLSSDFTATFRSKISFRIGDNPTMASGLKAMMQTFLKVLLTTPGTDSFSQRMGGNALKNLGSSFDLSQTSSVVSDFTIAVSRTATQIRTIQSKQSRLDDDERLLAANVLHVRFDPNLTALIARVELIPQSGKRAIVNLEL
jgi:hypothetical protein